MYYLPKWRNKLAAQNILWPSIVLLSKLTTGITSFSQLHNVFGHNVQLSCYTLVNFLLGFPLAVTSTIYISRCSVWMVGPELCLGEMKVTEKGNTWSITQIGVLLSSFLAYFVIHYLLSDAIFYCNMKFWFLSLLTIYE